jgi:hypothetical protein
MFFELFLPLFTTTVGNDDGGDVDGIGFRNRRKSRIIR